MALFASILQGILFFFTRPSHFFLSITNLFSSIIISDPVPIVLTMSLSGLPNGHAMAIQFNFVLLDANFVKFTTNMSPDISCLTVWDALKAYKLMNCQGLLHPAIHLGNLLLSKLPQYSHYFIRSKDEIRGTSIPGRNCFSHFLNESGKCLGSNHFPAEF